MAPKGLNPGLEARSMDAEGWKATPLGDVTRKSPPWGLFRV